MSIIEVLGYTGALLVGISLGLTGGGGSILALPVMVYLHNKNPEITRTYSLFIIGSGAFFGMLQNVFLHRVNPKVAIGFLIPSFISIYLTSTYIYPHIPPIIYTYNHVIITKPMFLMILFACVMLIASYFMIKNGIVHINDAEIQNQNQSINIPMIIILGIVAGFLTELLGAGGGFIIVPALVIFAKLSMKVAIGTSLLIIFVNSLVGILFHISTENIEWNYLLIFTFISLIGIGIGTYLTRFIKGNTLKIGFGIFIIIMGLFILIEKLILT